MKSLRLVAPLLLAVGISVAAACGGDSTPTLAEYIAKMDAVDKDVDARFDGFFGEDATEPESANARADAFGEVVAFVLGQYDGVSPAKEAKDAHERIVSGIREYQTALAAATDDLEEDAPSEEFESIFGDEDIMAAEEKFNAAFCDIQKLADDNNIEADVGCGGEEEGVDPSTLPAQEATEVLIEDFAFDPPHIQVSVGDTVTWTQGADDEPHTATADDGSFDSDTLSDAGDTFPFTFEEAGEFSYFCAIHPEMLGLVTVTE